MPTLTAAQVYDYARSAGFDPETARKMVAIAQRESSLNTGVVGTINAEKETSYGLWQINLKDAGIRNLMATNGINEGNIRDPAVNARAAYLLYGGREANLNTAWYVNVFGNKYGYGEKYNANLNALPGVDVFEMVHNGGGALNPPPTIDYGTSNGYDFAPADPGAGGNGGGGGNELAMVAPTPDPDTSGLVLPGGVDMQTLLLLTAAGLVVWWLWGRD